MAGPFVERFRGIVEPLFDRRFTEADGIPERELDAILGRCGYEVPEALQDFYTVVGRCEAIMEHFNRFHLPGDLSRMDDKRVFCEENQVVVFWGYDEDQGWQTDPKVYQGLNNDEVEWYPEPGQCSDFLVGAIYWQALNGGLPEVEFRHRASQEVRQAAASWPLVYKDGDFQLFSRGSVAFSLSSRDAAVEVQAAALSKGALRELWQLLGLEQRRA